MLSSPLPPSSAVRRYRFEERAAFQELASHEPVVSARSSPLRSRQCAARPAANRSRLSLRSPDDATVSARASATTERDALFPEHPLPARRGSLTRRRIRLCLSLRSSIFFPVSFSPESPECTLRFFSLHPVLPRRPTRAFVRPSLHPSTFFRRRRKRARARARSLARSPLFRRAPLRTPLRRRACCRGDSRRPRWILAFARSPPRSGKARNGVQTPSSYQR